MNRPLSPPPFMQEFQTRTLPPVDHYAGNPRFLRKALDLFSTEARIDITIDLEDGAAIGGEAGRARELAEIAMTHPSTRPFGVRIHPLDSAHWLSDAELFLSRCKERVSHVTIPKVEDPHLTKAAIFFIRELRRRHADTETGFRFHLLIESSAALANIHELAQLRDVRCLDFGIMDFVSSFGTALPRSAMQSPDQFLNSTVLAAKNALVCGARAHDISAAHNVTTQVSYPEQARADARTAKRLGFTRMWSIHPAQAPMILEGLAPTGEERALAEKVLGKAATNDWGPIEVDGVLYDRASYRWLWQVL